MWIWVATALAGPILKGDLADFEHLTGPEETPVQQLAWDVLRLQPPRHPLPATRQGQWLGYYLAFGFFQWDALPTSMWQGGPALERGAVEISMDIPEGEAALVLPVERVESGQLTAVGTLDDGSTLTWWFDTGAPVSVVTRSVARRVGIPDEAHFGRISRVAIGGLVLTDLEVAVVDDAALDFGEDARIEAILGWNVFWRLAVTFDGRAGTVSFAPPSGAPDRDRLLWWDYPLVRATVGGEPVVLALDTGSDQSYLTEYAAKRLGLATTKGSHDTSRSGAYGTALQAKRALAEPVTVQVGEVSLPFSGDLFGDQWDWGPVPIDGCIGADRIGDFGAVHIDMGSTLVEIHPYAGLQDG